MADIEAVVFDLGGVLIDWDPRYLYRKLFDSDDEVEWFLANVCTGDWNHRQDLGRPFSEGIAELVARFPQYESEIRLYRERWHEMLAGEIAGSVEILKRLKRQGNRLIALTNWSAETFPCATERFGFLDDFDGLVVSGRLGIAKPDPAIYEHVLAEYALEPSTTIFIDDRDDNVDAARAIGMKGHRFQSAGELQRFLSDEGVL